MTEPCASEAFVIAIELHGTPSPQPLMQDLFKNVMSALGIKIVSIDISDLVNDVFKSYMVFEMASRHVRVDARPSDAIAIAARARTPIYVENSVLERAGVAPDHKQGQDVQLPGQYTG